MPWVDDYKEKLVTAEEAVSAIRSNDRISPLYICDSRPRFSFLLIISSYHILVDAIIRQRIGIKWQGGCSDKLKVPVNIEV